MPAKNLIKEEYVNVTRQTSFDYLKAFAITFMVIIHVLEESTQFFDVGSTNFTKIIEFLGGPLAAPVFMFSMGIGMIYSKHRSPKELIIRGIKIYLLGYVLNFLRFALVYLIFGNIYGFFDLETFLYYIFQSDILCFAGVAFILTGILKRLNIPLWGMLIIAFVMQAVSNVFPFEATTFFGKYFAIIFVPCYYTAYFPLFNWYIFPVMGFVVAKYLKQASNLDYWHKVILYVSTIVLFGVIIGSKFYGIDVYSYFDAYNETYYIQNFFSTLFCLSAVGVAESLIYFIFNKVKAVKLKKLMTYMSNNLNSIYIVQWLIIGNCNLIFALEIIEKLPLWTCVPLGLVITALSVFLNKYVKKIVKI